MTTVLITENAEEQATEMGWALNTEGAKNLFKSDVAKHIAFLEEGMRLGTRVVDAGPTAREILLYKRKIWMRYDEPEEGVVEIFEFLWAKNRH